MKGDAPVFLNLQQVLRLHADSLQQFGGSDGVRDLGLVESALGAAENAWWYTGDVFRVAATYAYSIAESQAFLDGNKRTAVVAAVVFLRLNQLTCPENTAVLHDAMIGIARKTFTKEQLGHLLERLCSRS